ncbi:MAG: V-type ATP synthase subunit E [Deltaproteobacteria bacterium]
MEKRKEQQAVPGQEKNAELIVARIREEASREAQSLVAAAKDEADRVLRQASDEAESRRGAILDQARAEIAKSRERVLSGISLEKKRLLLEEKDRFIRQVLSAVSEQARRFRGAPGYDQFLYKAVAEGAKVIGEPRLEVRYAFPDEKLFASGDFIAGLGAFCRKAAGKDFTFIYTKSDFDEPGVVILSPDGRIQFDNRFSSRLSRLEEAIYARLLKESF